MPEACGIINMTGFHLRVGTRSYSFPADAAGPQSSFLQWDVTDPGWSVGDQIIVRLTGPASGNQVEVDPPTVTGTPASKRSRRRTDSGPKAKR